MINYKDTINPNLICWHPFHHKCIYCGSKLVFEDIEKFTDYSFKDFQTSLRSNELIVKELQPDSEDWMDVDLSVLDENYYKSSEDNFCYCDTQIAQCLTCGWWKITEEYNTVNDNMWQIFFEVAGSVKNLNINDLSTPIDEIRSHLVRKYSDRFRVNPRLFENTVVSVFRDLGYDSVCTAYSNDGGIDAVLSGKEEPIAIQVKRTKNSIKIEQIRSFLGALIINKFTKGMYVSAANYQSGCNKIANNYNIELINGDKFFDVLKEAQIIKHTQYCDIDLSQLKSLYFTGRYPMNSL